MTFCFKCLRCGAREESMSREAPFCNACADRTANDSGVFMVRDYRAEATGVQVFTSALGDGKVSTKHVQGDV